MAITYYTHSLNYFEGVPLCCVNLLSVVKISVNLLSVVKISVNLLSVVEIRVIIAECC
jgi:hypothetical protein